MAIDLLLVDDEEHVRNSLKGMAESYGLSVRAFAMGSEALAWLDALAPEELPRCAFVDMCLRGGSVYDETQASEDLAHRLLAMGLRDRFYFITGHYQGRDREITRSTGVTDDHVLIKPILENGWRVFEEVSQQKMSGSGVVYTPKERKLQLPS